MPIPLLAQRLLEGRTGYRGEALSDYLRSRTEEAQRRLASTHPDIEDDERLRILSRVLRGGDYDPPAFTRGLVEQAAERPKPPGFLERLGKAADLGDEKMKGLIGFPYDIPDKMFGKDQAGGGITRRTGGALLGAAESLSALTVPISAGVGMAGRLLEDTKPPLAPSIMEPSQESPEYHLEKYRHAQLNAPRGATVGVSELVSGVGMRDAAKLLDIPPAELRRKLAAEVAANGELTEDDRSVPTEAARAFAAGSTEMGQRLGGGGATLGAYLFTGDPKATLEELNQVRAEERAKSSGFLASTIGADQEDVTERGAAKRLLGDDSPVATEALASALELTDVTMLTPAFVTMVGRGMLKGAYASRVAAHNLTEHAKFTAIGVAARREARAQTRVFIKRARETAQRGGWASPEATAEFIDTVMDVSPGASDPNAVAGLIERVGTKRAAELMGWTDDQLARMESALGPRLPSDFGVKLSKPQRQLDQLRADRLSRISTLDPATEVALVGERVRMASVVPELSDDLVATARAKGLKIMRVDNVAGLPKGANRIRVIYNPELVDGIWRGLKNSKRADLKSLAMAGATPRRWLRTMARKDPEHLAHVSAGSLGGDFAGEVNVVFGVKKGTGRVGWKEAGDSGRMTLVGGFHKLEGVHGSSLSKRISAELDNLRSQGALPDDFEIHIEGLPIEELAAKSEITEEVVRYGQDALRRAGLDHDRATTLFGGLLGSPAPGVRAALVDDAARAVYASGKVGSLHEATEIIKSAVDDIREVAGPRFAPDVHMVVDDAFPPKGVSRDVPPPDPPKVDVDREWTMTTDEVQAMKNAPAAEVTLQHEATVRAAIEAGEPVPFKAVDSVASRIKGELAGLRASLAEPESLLSTKVDPEKATRARAAVVEMERRSAWWDHKLSVTRAGETPSGLGAMATAGPEDSIIMNATGSTPPGAARQLEQLDTVMTPRGAGEVIAARDSPARELMVRLDDGSIETFFDADIQLTRGREHHPEVVKRVEVLLGLEADAYRQSSQWGKWADEALALDRQRMDLNDALKSEGASKDLAARRAMVSRFEDLTDQIGVLKSKMKASKAQADDIARRTIATSDELRETLGVKPDGTPLSTYPPEVHQAAKAAILDPETVVKREGKTPAQALAEQKVAGETGWEVSPAFGEGGGPNNPRMVDAVAGGRGPDISNLLIRHYSDLPPVWRSQGVFEWAVSPQTAFLRALGPKGNKLGRDWMISFQDRQRFLDLGREMAAARNKVLKSPRDRYLAGRLIENDFDAIPRAWAEEVLTGATPRAEAVMQYNAMISSATDRIAGHVKLPLGRRMRDYFGHIRDPKLIIRALTNEYSKARKSGRPEAIAAAKSRLQTWASKQIKRSEFYDWEVGNTQKGVHFGPLEERLDNMADYIKDPEAMVKLLEQQAARFAQLDSLLPKYDELAKLAGESDAAIQFNAPTTKVGQRIMDAKKLLFEPKSRWQQGLDRFVLDSLVKPYGPAMYRAIPTNVLDATSQLMRWAGFMMHLGFRTSSAIMNLTSIPMHTMLRMAPTDVVQGTAHFFADQIKTGNFFAGIPGGKPIAKVIGTDSPSDLYRMWHSRMAGSVPKHWELPMAHEVSTSKIAEWLSRGQEASMDVAGLMFRGTETLNRGGAFYAEGLRAYRAIDDFTTTGVLPEKYYDGWIAPLKNDLLRDRKLVIKRIPMWEQAHAGGKKLAADVPDLMEIDRLKGILASGDDELRQAAKMFDAEKRIREATSRGGDRQAFVRDVGTEAADETQLMYTKQNRPVKIVEHGAWAQTVLQFQDFTRSQLELVAQTMPFFTKRRIGGKLRNVPGPGFAFVGLLYALGGPRAMPFIEFFTKTAYLANPEFGERIDDLMDETIEAVPFTLARLGVDISARVRPGINPPRSSEPYKDANVLVKALASHGGAFIEPVATAIGAVGSAGQAASGLSELTGMPVGRTEDHPGAAAMAVTERGMGLRKTVEAEHLRVLGLPLGKFLHENKYGRGVVNLPSKAAGAVGMSALSESLAVRQGRDPGTLTLPGDSITGTFAALKDTIRDAELQSGTIRRRQKVMTTATDADKLAAAFGFQGTAEGKLRREVRTIQRKGSSIDRGTQIAIDYLLDNYVVEDGGRPSVGQIVEQLNQQGIYGVGPSQVTDHIISRNKSIFSRQVATLSKTATRHLAEKEALRERLLEERDIGVEADNEQIALGARESYVTVNRRLFSAIASELEAKRKPWTNEMRFALMKEVKLTRDEELRRIFDRSLSNFVSKKVGIDIDDDMTWLHRIKNMDVPPEEKEARLRHFVDRISSAAGDSDTKKKIQLLEIGRWLVLGEGQ